MKTISILIALVVASCDGGSAARKVNDYADVIEAPAEEFIVYDEESSLGSSQETQYQKKIIKTGFLTYSVDDVAIEYDRIMTLLQKNKGYVSAESESRGGDRVNYNLTLKVPPQHFDSLLIAITRQQKVDSKSVNINDVTANYYDIQSRIENKKKLELRYQDILKKAVSVKDILEVERNLNQVRLEIESLEGELKLLNFQINYSTIDLSFYEIVPYELAQGSRPGFGARMLNSLTAGWDGFLTFFVYLIALWPFALVGTICWYVIIQIRKRRKKQPQIKTEE